MPPREPAQGFKFKTKGIQKLMDSKITDLPTLHRQLPGAVLVALNTKGVTQHFDGYHIPSEELCELSVAVLQKPHFAPNITQFCKQNNIQTLTIQIIERSYVSKISPIVQVDSAEAAGLKLHEYLSKVCENRILLGFEMYPRLKWIAEQYPRLAELFTGWCDIQELVSHRYDELPPQPDIMSARWRRPGFLSSLKSLGMVDWDRSEVPLAALQTVRSLSVLSGLLSAAPFNPKFDIDNHSIQVLCKILRRSAIKIGQKTHLFTAQVTTTDGDELPLQTPLSLQNLFMHHNGLQGVAMNARNEKLSKGGVRFWWVSFRSKQALDDFSAEVDGKKFEDIATAAGKAFENTPTASKDKKLRVLVYRATAYRRTKMQPPRAPQLDDQSDAQSPPEPFSVFDVASEVRLRKASPPRYENASLPPLSDTPSLPQAKEAVVLPSKQAHLEAPLLDG